MNNQTITYAQARDRLDQTLAKAKSLSYVVTGEQGEVFRLLDECDQEII